MFRYNSHVSNASKFPILALVVMVHKVFSNKACVGCHYMFVWWWQITLLTQEHIVPIEYVYIYIYIIYISDLVVLMSYNRTLLPPLTRASAQLLAITGKSTGQNTQIAQLL